MTGDEEKLGAGLVSPIKKSRSNEAKGEFLKTKTPSEIDEEEEGELNAPSCDSIVLIKTDDTTSEDGQGIKERKKGILKHERTYSNKHVDFNLDVEFVPFDENKDFTIEIQIVEQMPKKIVSYAALFAQQKALEEENHNKERSKDTENKSDKLKNKNTQKGKNITTTNKTIEADINTEIVSEVGKNSSNLPAFGNNVYEEIKPTEILGQPTKDNGKEQISKPERFSNITEAKEIKEGNMNSESTLLTEINCNEKEHDSKCSLTTSIKESFCEKSMEVKEPNPVRSNNNEIQNTDVNENMKNSEESELIDSNGVKVEQVSSNDDHETESEESKNEDNRTNESEDTHYDSVYDNSEQDELFESFDESESGGIKKVPKEITSNLKEGVKNEAECVMKEEQDIGIECPQLKHDKDETVSDSTSFLVKEVQLSEDKNISENLSSKSFENIDNKTSISQKTCDSTKKLNDMGKLTDKTLTNNMLSVSSKCCQANELQSGIPKSERKVTQYDAEGQNTARRLEVNEHEKGDFIIQADSATDHNSEQHTRYHTDNMSEPVSREDTITSEVTTKPVTTDSNMTKEERTSSIKINSSSTSEVQ